MSTVEELRRGRVSYAVKLREFLQIATRTPGSVVFFFEGHDCQYYAARIDMIRPDIAWEGINCGGKDNVLKLYSILAFNATHSSVRMAFIIDKDFDEHSQLIADSRVYVTPCYSVENLYVTPRVMERVLKHVFSTTPFSEGDDSYERCINRFQQLLDEFIREVERLNAWALLNRRHEWQHPGCGRTNISGIPIGKCVNVSLDGITSQYGIRDLEAWTGACLGFREDDLERVANEFSWGQRMMAFRGKWQMYWFRVFLSKLVDDARSLAPSLFVSRRNVSLTVSERTFLADLCQYAETPQCLFEFLKRM